MKIDRVTQMGLDAHKTFSKVTGRESQGRMVCRMRFVPPGVNKEP